MVDLEDFRDEMEASLVAAREGDPVKGLGAGSPRSPSSPAPHLNIGYEISSEDFWLMRPSGVSWFWPTR